MTRNKTYLLTLILSSAAWLSPSLSGQTTFVYERGKMFNDVDAFRMEQAIDPVSYTHLTLPTTERV